MQQTEQSILVRGYAKALVGLVIMQVIQTLVGAVMVRLFPTAEAFGRFNLVLQILGLAALFTGLGIDTALTVQLSRERRGEGAARRFSMAYRFSVWYGVALVALLAAVAPLLARLYGDPQLTADLRAAAPALLGSSLLMTAQGTLIGWSQFGWQAVTTIVQQVTGGGALAAGAVLFPGAPAQGAFATSAAGGLTVAGITLALVARSGQFSLGLRGDWQDLRPMATFGIPYFVGNFFKAYQQMFIIMLTGLASMAEVGYLSNAWRVAGFAGIVTWGFMIVSLPFVSEMTEQADQRRRTRTVMRYNHYLLFAVSVGLSLYAAELITWVFGEAYLPSARYLPVLAMGLLLSGVARLGAQCLAGAGLTRATAIILAVPGVLVLIVAPLVIPRAVEAGPWVFLGGWATATFVSLWMLFRHGLGPVWQEDFGRPATCTALFAGGVLLGQYLGGAWHLALALLGLFGALSLLWRWERAVKPHRAAGSGVSTS